MAVLVPTKKKNKKTGKVETYYYFYENYSFINDTGKKSYKRRLIPNVSHPGKCSKKQALIELERFNHNKKAFESFDISFENAFTHFYTIYKTNAFVKKSTLVNFETLAKLYLEFFKHMPIKEFSWNTYENWRTHMIHKGYSNSTITHAKAGIIKILEYSLRQGWINHVPNLKPLFSEQKKTSSREKIDRLSEKEIQ